MIIGVVALEDGTVGVIKRAVAVLLVLIILSDVLGAALKKGKYQYKYRQDRYLKFVDSVSMSFSIFIVAFIIITIWQGSLN